MAQTRGAYELIDDSEVDSESPITESLMTRLRDQWYAALCDGSTTASNDERVSVPGRLKTAETDTQKVLQPDGAGGCIWSSAGTGSILYTDTITDPATTTPDIIINDPALSSGAWHVQGFVRSREQGTGNTQLSKAIGVINAGSLVVSKAESWAGAVVTGAATSLTFASNELKLTIPTDGGGITGVLIAHRI